MNKVKAISLFAVWYCAVKQSTDFLITHDVFPGIVALLGITAGFLILFSITEPKEKEDAEG